MNFLPKEGFTKKDTKGRVLTVMLQVADRLWPVKLYTYSYSSNNFSAGWTAFVRENTLQVGDVCVFELIMKDHAVFKVYIFRCLD